MRQTKMAFPGFILTLCLGLPVLLAACGSSDSHTTQPAAAPTNKVPPTWTPASPLTSTPALPATTTNASSGAKPSSTPKPYITPLPQERQPETTAGPATGCVFSASYINPSLSEQIKNSRDIVQTQVTNIGELTWNTADGQAPPDLCGSGYDQYSPVEITVKESYKGQLVPGTKLVLWLSGAPGSYKQGNYDYFPKNGETLIFFLGDEQNLRRDNPANPMNTRTKWELYRMQPPGSGKWFSQITTTPFTLEWLKAVIKDPTIEPTPTPFPPPPTPYLKAGQTFQPTEFYKLDKAVRVYIKAPNLQPPLIGDEMPGSDRFNRLVKAFNQPLIVTRNLTDYPFSNTSIPFGFELADNSYVSFVYFPETGTIVHELKDNYNRVELAAPPELKAIFGL